MNYVLLSIVIICTAIVLIILGFIAINKYDKTEVKKREIYSKIKINKINKFLNLITLLPFYKKIKKYFLKNFEFSRFENIDFVVNIVLWALTAISIIMITQTINYSAVWYNKILFVLLSLCVPFYFTSLLFEVHKNRINKKVPIIIDEFKTVFANNKRVIASIRETGENLGGSLGKKFITISMCGDVDAKLESFANSLNNVWFNAFVQIVRQYKENGGDLLAQLYKLNNTVSTYNNIEKKKNMKIIMFEIFVVLLAVLAVPISNFFAEAFTDQATNQFIDSQSNKLIGYLIVLTLVSLAALRSLRND